jgi:DNA-binding IclR family transcriptional regulator
VDTTSGIGTIGKAMSVLTVLEAGPASLKQIVQATGLPRPTAHRIAGTLERHRMISRDALDLYTIGPRAGELANACVDALASAARKPLIELRDRTGEAAQLYRIQGSRRVCVAAASRPIGLRTTIPVGTCLPLTGGSASHILLAWAPPDRLLAGLDGASFTATTLARVRRRGWSASCGEGLDGMSSVAAPVWSKDGVVAGAVTITGPDFRMTTEPGRRYALTVMDAADALTKAIGGAPRSD